MNLVKLAILDLNNGFPNQGLRCIVDIAREFRSEVEFDIFDVRAKNEIPDLSYNIYLCSGGPGSPLLEGHQWEENFLSLIDNVWNHNKTAAEEDKKFMFFICHSFQLACQHFGIATLTKRKSTAFGIQPVHKTHWGLGDEIFKKLKNPFYVVESRDWQVVQPDLGEFKKKGASILALEKIRTHVEYERAIMAVRFSDEMVGTQFHPEADADGLIKYMESEEMKEKVITKHGAEKYHLTLQLLSEEDKIEQTRNIILPSFIANCISRIKSPVLV